MKDCPQCHTSDVSNDANFCARCGYRFEPSAATASATTKDDMAFEVAEAHTVDREFVGGETEFDSPTDRISDQAADGTSEAVLAEDRVDPSAYTGDPEQQQPLGCSTPALPLDDHEAIGGSDTPAENHADHARTAPLAIGKSIPSSCDKSDTDGHPRSKHQKAETAGESASARQTRNPREAYGSPTPGRETDPATELPPPAADTGSSLPQPTMAGLGKGKAFYYRNFIQLVGRHELRPNDQMELHGRTYALRPRRISPKVIMVAAASVFVLLLALTASFFVRNSATGTGELIGIALDTDGTPYLRQATIRLPELKTITKTNSQGLFRQSDLPIGSHRIEYIINNEVVAAEFATITDNKATMITLHPQEHVPPSEYGDSSQRETAAFTEANGGDAQLASTGDGSNRRGSADSPRSSSKSSGQTATRKAASKSSTDKPGKIKLDANVDNASLSIDGKVIGAGNLTFSGIEPGTHAYEVSRDGYKAVTGTVTVQPGKSSTLQIALAPLSEQEKRASYSAEDFYYAGASALSDKNYEAAIRDLTEALSMEPGMAKAYNDRAEAYRALRQKPRAHNDYLRAAEILRVQKDFNSAITAFNQAIEMDENSVTARLGRADLYRAAGEDIAAIADYEAVRSLDKDNVQACNGLGEARLRRGSYKMALDHFKDARKLDSQNPLTYHYMMLCYLAMDDTRNVKKTYDKFMEIASERDVQRLQSDASYSAVLRVVESH